VAWRLRPGAAKKTDRLQQLLATFDSDNIISSVQWNVLQEELADIANYARMFGAINKMWIRRNGDDNDN